MDCGQQAGSLGQNCKKKQYEAQQLANEKETLQLQGWKRLQPNGPFFQVSGKGSGHVPNDG